MRVPKRRGEIERAALAEPEDHHLTPTAINRAKTELDRLISHDRPEAISEVRRLAEMGDFSENAGYQIAKATLRRINNRIETLKERIQTAIPIDVSSSHDGRVRLGSTVVLQAGNKKMTLQLVGSLETNPAQGRISHHSPLGSALMNAATGAIVEVADRSYEIISVR